MIDSIENAIMNLLSTTERLTPAQIVAQLHYHPRRVIMQRINQLICNEQLMYTYELGTAFVRLSYNKAVRISDRVVLIPPNRHLPNELSTKVAIKLAKGAAFGDGHHPTTSLIINLLDKTLHKNNIAIKKALDIGTGTGVLAIAAAKLGAEKVIATDIDPIAIYESQINVEINHMNDCISLIKSDTFPALTYQLMMANLRYPSLVNLAKRFYHHIDKQGLVICSGYKREESTHLIRKFKQHKLECVYDMQLNQWAGGVFMK